MAGLGRVRMPHLPGDSRLRRVLLAYGLSALMEFGSWLTILLVAYEEGGAVAVGATSVAMLLPSVILVPLVAGSADRMPRGRALSLSYAAEALAAAATALLLLVSAPFWLVVVGGAVLTFTISLARPTHFAALPMLAQRPGDLVAANALSTVLEGLTIFTGFVLAGLVTDVLGAWVSLIAGAVLALTAALLARGLGLPVASAGDGDSADELRSALGAAFALRATPGALLLLLLLGITSVVEGSGDTLTVAFNDEVLGGTGTSAGILAGAYGLGVAVGGATLAGLAHRPRLAPLVLGGTLVVGAAEASVALQHALLPAAAALTIAGVGVSLVVVAARTLLQRTTHDEVLVRVFAIQEGVALTGLTIGGVVGPALVVWLGPSLAFVPLGLVLATLGVLAFPLLRRLEGSARARTREVALLRRVPFLAALPPYELERLALAATWQRAAPGEVVVAQGEVGDTYYLIASGTLEVDVGGVRRPTALGPGDGFGEIALVLEVPRTATVTAASQSDLLVLDAPSFIAAVTSSSAGAAALRQAARDRLDRDAGR